MRGIPRPWCSLTSDRFPALGLSSITPPGGERGQHSCWKLVLTAVCIFRPHSGCHYDSILGSHLAGRVSVTCRKAHQGHQQSKLYVCSLPAPALNLRHQPAFQQRLKAWAAQDHTVIGSVAHRWKSAKRPFCPWLIQTGNKRSFVKNRGES